MVQHCDDGGVLKRWKDARERDMTKVGLKEANITNRATWRKKINSHTGDPRQAGDNDEEGTSPHIQQWHSSNWLITPI